MRFRLRVVAFLAAIGAAMMVAPLIQETAPVSPDTTEAIARVPASPTLTLVESLRRHRPDARITAGLRTEAAELATARFSSAPREDRPTRAVLLDGSDRWRSLLLGAPPLLG